MGALSSAVPVSVLAFFAFTYEAIVSRGKYIETRLQLAVNIGGHGEAGSR